MAMNGLEFRSRCATTGSAIYKVKDSDQNIRVKGSSAESVGGRDAEPKHKEGKAMFGVYVVRFGVTNDPRNNPANQAIENLVAWKHTKEAADAIQADLSSLGVACYVEPIQGPPPQSAS
jgi:hypothetical protein